MKYKILLITLSLILTSNVICAEKLFSLLQGKIVTSHPNDIQVLVTESDGSILDMTTPSGDGIYKLDLTIMDTPSLPEINKLIVEVKGKSGLKSKYPVKNNLKTSGDTIVLKPFIFNK